MYRPLWWADGGPNENALQAKGYFKSSISVYRTVPPTLLTLNLPLLNFFDMSHFIFLFSHEANAVGIRSLPIPDYLKPIVLV